MSTKPRPKARTGDFDVGSCVADIAFRLSERLSEAVSSIADLVQDEIEGLRDDALTELLYAGVEGNVTTILHALRCGIAVEDVDAPTTALEHARRLAWHNDTVGAASAVDKLATGLELTKAAATVEVTSAVTSAMREQGYELGGTLAALLME